MVLSEIASFLLFSAINRHYSHKLRSQNNKKTQNNHKKTLHRNDMAFFRKFANKNRSQKITFTSVVGNVAKQPATFKAVVYITVNSMAIVIDAVNNHNNRPS